MNWIVKNYIIDYKLAVSTYAWNEMEQIKPVYLMWTLPLPSMPVWFTRIHHHIIGMYLSTTAHIPSHFNSALSMLYSCSFSTVQKKHDRSNNNFSQSPMMFVYGKLFGPSTRSTLIESPAPTPDLLIFLCLILNIAIFLPAPLTIFLNLFVNFLL